MDGIHMMSNQVTQTVNINPQVEICDAEIKMKVPPYHLFECLGEKFLYDTSSCQFFCVDEPIYHFLELCQVYPITRSLRIFKKEGLYSHDVADKVKDEVVILTKHGLLAEPDYSISTEQMERQLEQRYTASWNKLELALSESCNLACKYCYCSTCRDMPNQGLMNETVARQAITWLFAMSGQSENLSITFFGGEPLLNKPVLRFAVEYSQRLAKLHGKKIYYSMTTNGTLLDDEVIGFIKRYNFGLMVSLDGPPEIHNAQCPDRQGNGTFDAASAGIKRLMKRRRSVTVRATMTHSVPNMMDLINYFEKFGFTRIVLGRTVNPVNPSSVDCTDEDFAEIERQEREAILPWVLKKLAAGEEPKYYPYLKELNINKKVSPFKCGACRGTTTVGANGELYPCHRFMGMNNWRIGDITNGPDIKKCKKFWRDYRKAVAPSCQFCWMWAQCKGPCPWEIAQADGSFCGPRHCDKIKQYIERSVYIKNKRDSLSVNKIKSKIMH